MDTHVRATLAPRCIFHERTPVEGGYSYDRISVSGPGGDTYLCTDHPPSVGDMISLWDACEQRGGQFRVMARSWLHPSWGSADWPYGQAAPSAGPLLDIVVEAAEGLFGDEVPHADEEDSDG